jgi:hypothetical protein
MRCNAAAISGTAFCVAHSGRLDMSEIGRKGVKARLARRNAPRADGRERVRDEVRKAIERDPKAVVDALMSSAKGIEVLWALGYSEDAAGKTGEGAKNEIIVVESGFCIGTDPTLIELGYASADGFVPRSPRESRVLPFSWVLLPTLEEYAVDPTSPHEIVRQWQEIDRRHREAAVAPSALASSEQIAS